MDWVNRINPNIYIQRDSIHAAGHHATRVRLTIVCFPSQLIYCVLITYRWKYSTVSYFLSLVHHDMFFSKVHSIGCLLVRYLKMLSNEHLRNINPRLSTFTFENYGIFVLCHLHFTSHMCVLVSSLFLPISKPLRQICLPCVPAFLSHMLKPFWADLVTLDQQFTMHHL